ncbi:MAG TPA: hypothetical protein PK402_08455 [Tepidisphaeraceae bacterium]|nr:hypothetical protein [Tepidisphaeraceae bacterium]
MNPKRNSQPLSEFQRDPARTLNRLNESGEAEFLTEGNETKAVLLTPDAFDALERDAQLTRDVEIIKQARQEIADGKGMEANEFFDQLRQQQNFKYPTRRPAPAR